MTNTNTNRKNTRRKKSNRKIGSSATNVQKNDLTTCDNRPYVHPMYKNNYEKLYKAIQKLEKEFFGDDYVIAESVDCTTACLYVIDDVIDRYKPFSRRFNDWVRKKIDKLFCNG